MTRKEILDEAAKIVCQDRERQYGEPEYNFTTIAAMWNEYIHGTMLPLDACDVAAMMILLKVARISTGKRKNDNWVDIAGYAACGGEIESDKT